MVRFGLQLVKLGLLVGRVTTGLEMDKFLPGSMSSGLDKLSDFKDKLDSMLQAVFDQDVLKVIRDSSECFPDWWFAAHFADLVTCAGWLEPQQLPSGMRQAGREGTCQEAHQAAAKRTGRRHTPCRRWRRARPLQCPRRPLPRIRLHRDHTQTHPPRR